jgi:phosphoesterase RecJ-like protein
MAFGSEIKNVPDELFTFIKTGSKFIIAGHKEPDGDCIGSQLALCSALVRLGKSAIVCTAGPFKRTELKNYQNQFKNIPTEEEKSGAKVLIVDCQNIERTGNLQDFIKELPYAIIDHHVNVINPPSTVEAPVYVDANAPSCTVLIEKLINTFELELTAEEASLLLFGICTDTGFFRHLTEKDGNIFESAARMVRHGASPRKIFKIINGGKSLNSRIMTGNILSRIETYHGGKLIISYEALEEFEKYGLEGRDSDTVFQMLLAIEGVEATAIIRQESEETCTVSLRSTDKIDVARIAASFQGGGHKNAAGLTMKGNISSVKQIMLESFSKVFI